MDLLSLLGHESALALAFNLIALDIYWDKAALMPYDEMPQVKVPDVLKPYHPVLNPAGPKQEVSCG
jgi:hypothetical protein